jgi:hypothetical protein
MEALRVTYGEHDYEYWNAGVEGYDTHQELGYYLRYNRAIGADQVILTVHNNDFWPSKAILKDEHGRLHPFPATRLGALPGSQWLMAHSRIFQRLLLEEQHLTVRPPALQRVADSLQRLREVLERDGAQFKVILHPNLLSEERWPERTRLSRRESINMFRRYGIQYFDLLEPLNAALEDGEEVQETPGDPQHPNEVVSHYFADYFKAQQLFESDGQTLAQGIVSPQGKEPE